MARLGPPPRNEAERAHRILDVAADLMLHRGHDKITINDVARSAGFAKGTVLLHWRDREDLFTALLHRERVYLMEEVRSRAPATLGELLGEFVGAARRRPLLRAVLLGGSDVLGDSEVLGRVARTRLGGPAGPALSPVAGVQPHCTTGPGGAARTYLRRLIEHGAVYGEPADHAWVITAIVLGFAHLPDRLHQEASPSERQIAGLVSGTVERVLGTGRVLPREDAEAVARATLDFLDSVEEVARHQLAACLGVRRRPR